MPIAKLKNFLDDQHVQYISIIHSRAHTAQETAEVAHIPGRQLAKTVMVKLDGKMAMVVLPASEQIDLDLLQGCAGVNSAELADEKEFSALFPQCEIGAMPPFGNLYGMMVYVEEDLTTAGTIAFNAGSHLELIQLSYNDFERLVKPRIVRIASTYTAA